MEALTGIGKLDRERLASILRGTRGTVSVAEAASILGVSATDAAKMLSRWNRKGWLSRVKRGLYVPVPLEASSTDVALEDPWQIAARLYAPCYIGGWSAAEHWDLTEQVFRTTVVMTRTAPRDRKPVIKGSPFLLCSVPESRLFGLKTVWRDRVKVMVSDPARTLVDMLAEPRLGGGIRSVEDMLVNYLRLEETDLPLLLDYAARLGNGAVYKRLGFLLEHYAPAARAILDECARRLTQGNARLDPKLPAERLVSRWRLWVPGNWLKEMA